MPKYPNLSCSVYVESENEKILLLEIDREGREIIYFENADNPVVKEVCGNIEERLKICFANDN